MDCLKSHGFENEGFDPGGIADDASHRAGNRKLKNWVPDKDPCLQHAGAGYSRVCARRENGEVKKLFVEIRLR
jgi:hypothetical protein